MYKIFIYFSLSPSFSLSLSLSLSFYIYIYIYFTYIYIYIYIYILYIHFKIFQEVFKVLRLQYFQILCVLPLSEVYSQSDYYYCVLQYVPLLESCFNLLLVVE